MERGWVTAEVGWGEEVRFWGGEMEKHCVVVVVVEKEISVDLRKKKRRRRRRKKMESDEYNNHKDLQIKLKRTFKLIKKEFVIKVDFCIIRNPRKTL